MTEKWRPLSVRMSKSEEDYDAPYEGVPPWLVESLTGWAANQLQYGSGGRVKTDEGLLKEIERALRWALDWGMANPYTAMQDLLSAARHQPERFLDAIDFLLNKMNALDDDSRAESLETMLSEGGSEWRVGFRNGNHGLEHRVDETVQAAASKAMEGTDAAARLLGDAWHSMYGRDPDPSEAYRHAVQAVEAAASSVITPKDPKPTLGKMIVAMKDAPHKWTFPITPDGVSSVDVLRHMMELLWQGQHDRHGRHDPEGPLEVNSEEAEAAVHIAATLVHWFRSGAVKLAGT